MKTTYRACEQDLRCYLAKGHDGNHKYDPFRPRRTAAPSAATSDVEPRADEPTPRALTDEDRAYNRGWQDGNASALDACNPVIEQLQTALRVATHKPHDQAGGVDHGFPVCSVCGAIQTNYRASDVEPSPKPRPKNYGTVQDWNGEPSEPSPLPDHTPFALASDVEPSPDLDVAALMALLGPSHPHDEGRECGTCAAYNLLAALHTETSVPREGEAPE